MAEISKKTKEFVAGIAAEAERVETPCGDGNMVWRVWGSGPPVVLLHGGYGSWTHWIRNVLPLSRGFTVIAPDLPGLGESATPPEPHTAEGLARIVVDGLDAVLPRNQALHLAGFSFGGVLGGHVAAQLGDRARGFTVVGSNGLGLVRQPTDLRRVPEGASVEEALATHRHNLGAMLIADPIKDRRARGLSPIGKRAARAGQEPPVLARRHAGARPAAGHRPARRHLGRAATPPPIRISTSAPAPCARSSPRRGSR